MKLIYASGFSKSEREDWRPIVFSNINQAYKAILEAMDELEISMGKSKNQVRRGRYSARPA